MPFKNQGKAKHERKKLSKNRVKVTLKRDPTDFINNPPKTLEEIGQCLVQILAEVRKPGH